MLVPAWSNAATRCIPCHSEVADSSALRHDERNRSQNMTTTTDSGGTDLPVCGKCGTEVEDDGGREFPVSICRDCAEKMLREQGLL